MEDYLLKYARPLEKLSIYNLKHSLKIWSDNLKEELEGILFLKGSILNELIEQKVKNKLKEIISKLELIIVKEIEKIDSLLRDLDKFCVLEIDEKLYKTFEIIRENYNKILLNIQKMISSSSNLMISKEKYNQSRSIDKNSSNIKILDNLTKIASEQNSLEIIDKSNNDSDLPKRNREQAKSSVNKEANNVTKTLSSNNSKGNINTKPNSKKAREEKNKSVLRENRGKSPVKNNTTKAMSPKATSYLSTRKENKLNTINDYDTINKELDELKSNNMSSIYMVQKTLSDGGNSRELVEMKNDIKELLNSITRLTLRVENLEFENKQLKEENKNLYELINQNNTKTNTSNLTPIEVFKQNNLLENNLIIKDSVYEKKNLPTGLKVEGHNHNPRNRSGNSPLSDNSVFNSSHNTNPFENNAYTKLNNNMLKNNINTSKTNLNSTHTNSVPQSHSKKRFFLEKKEEN